MPWEHCLSVHAPCLSGSGAAPDTLLYTRVHMASCTIQCVSKEAPLFSSHTVGRIEFCPCSVTEVQLTDAVAVCVKCTSLCIMEGGPRLAHQLTLTLFLGGDAELLPSGSLAVACM